MSDHTDYHRGYTPALPSQATPVPGSSGQIIQNLGGAWGASPETFITGANFYFGMTTGTTTFHLTGVSYTSPNGVGISASWGEAYFLATDNDPDYSVQLALLGSTGINLILYNPIQPQVFQAAHDGSLTWNSPSIWHAGNDGAGSGLDADLLEGQHGSYYTNPANLSAPVPITKGGLGDSVSTPSWPDHTLAFFDAPNSRFAPTTYLQFDSSNQKLTHADTTTGVYQRYISNFKGSLQVVHSFTDGVNIDTLIQSGNTFSFDKPVAISANATLSGALTVAPAASVTQTTNKSTSVTANSEKVFITTSGAALNANTTVNFTLNNSAILSTNDMIFVTHHAGGTRGSYNIQAGATGVGTAQISIRNVSHFSLSETLQLRVWVLH